LNAGIVDGILKPSDRPRHSLVPPAALPFLPCRTELSLAQGILRGRNEARLARLIIRKQGVCNLQAYAFGGTAQACE
jgi:hypothetical protein